MVHWEQPRHVRDENIGNGLDMSWTRSGCLKYSKPPGSAVEDSLQRALLRAQVIVDEATKRHIINQVMLQHLGILRDTMYRGYYMLDTFRYKHHREKDAKDKL
ncbi:hypothetical protein EJB05_40823, partial [Eragrostis curvula]